MAEQDIFARIRRLENLIIFDLILTSAILGEKILEVILPLLS